MSVPPERSAGAARLRGAPRASSADVATASAAAGAVLLGSLSLSPVYAGTDWFLPVAITVLVVFATGVAARAAGPPLEARLTGGRRVSAVLVAAAVPAVPLIQLYAVTVLLTATYADRDAFAGVLPTWASLADLFRVFADGSAEMQEQAVPALPLNGLIALTVVLVGLVAVAVDVVAVVGRQPALAGLGLLVVFCVPVGTIKGGVGWLAIAAPAAGLALLLWADQRRRLTRRASGRRTAFGTAGLPALRTGALALALGLAGGAVVPTLAEGTFGSGMATAADGGGGSGTSLEPIATLHGQLIRPDTVNLLRVQASVPDPGYLRSVSLDQYDARRGWTLGGLNGQTSVGDSQRLAGLPAGLPSRQVNARVTVLSLSDRFLPVLTSPVRVTVDNPQAWRFDPTTGTVFGRGVTSSGTYQVTASEPRPTAALLQSSPALTADNPLARRYTELPALPPQVTDLVGTLTAGAPTPYGRVRAILDYFTTPANGFAYSLSTSPGTSGDHLVDFLQNKRGYCEQYAGAMAVMVRAAGVPARVAIGYTPGTVQRGGARVISSNDAHAWVEVYFADLGWVPFDPTPVAATRAVVLPWAPRQGSALPEQVPGSVPTAAAPTQAPDPRRLDRTETGAPLNLPAEQTATWVRPVLLGLGGLLLMVALAGTPAAVRLAHRRRRLAAGSPGAVWDELLATARDLGIGLTPSRTPRQTARELAERMAGAAEPAERMAGSASPAERMAGSASPAKRMAGSASPAKRMAGSASPAGESARLARPPRLGRGVVGGSAAVVAGVDAVRRLALAEEAASYAAPGRQQSADELRAALRTARHGLVRAVSRRRRLGAALWPSSLLLTDTVQRWVTPVRARLAAVARRRARSRVA